MTSRSTLKRATLALTIGASFFSASSNTIAADLFWDGPDLSFFGDAVNWATDDTGATDPGAAPTIGDTAIFNIATLNDPRTVILGASASVDGLVFNSTGNVLLQSNSNSRVLTLGAGGLTKTGTTGTVTVSPPTSGIRFATVLGASQAWTNNASDPTAVFVVRSAANGAFTLGNAGNQTLTLTGSNTGANQINSTLTNGAGVLSIEKTGTGTWIYTGGAASTYTGGLTISQGVFAHGFTTNASGLGTGTVTLNGGELRGGVSNMTVANPINVTANSTITAARYDLITGLTIVRYNSAFTSTGTPGNGPVLNFNIPAGVNSPTLTIAGDVGTINGFNGTFRFNQLAATGRAIVFGGTSSAGSNGENAIFEINGPNDSPIGVFGNRLQVLGVSVDVPVFKMGELRGSGVIAMNAPVTPLGVQTLEVGHLGTNSVFSGDIKQFQVVASTTMRLNKVGAGSLTLSGSNDYMGGTLVSSGTLIAAVDAPISKFFPTDAVAQNVNITSSVFTTNSTAANSPMPHGLADGDRIIAQANLNAADAASLLNVPLYVKVLTPETFTLYTDTALTTQQSFTDTAAFTTRIVMPSAFGSGATPIELGTGADSNSVSILAGTATTPTITIARDVHVAGNTGGTSTIGSAVDGNSVFSGAITLAKNVEITSASAGANTVTVSGAISGTSFGLTKVGTGNATLSAPTNTYTGNTTVSAGTLNITGNHTTGANYSVAANANLITNNVRVTNALTIDGTATINANGGTSGASKVETLTISAGGKLNLKDNDLVVGTGTVAAVRTAIKTGVAGAAGITSDLPAFGITTGFGYALGNDSAISPLLAGSLTGQTYDADSVLVKYTFLGDADLDGDSDLNDLGLWAQSFTGDLGNPAIPATYWTSGDFDYDGDTDLNDLGFWAGTFTGDLGGGAGSLIVVAPGAPAGAISALNSIGITVVPEPSTFVLASVGLVGLAIARRRKK